jgi:hypothetical protein
MLVSVTERTREIGLRQAVGARRWDIRNQFLIEAVMLCLLGGLTGIALGIGAAVAIAELVGWPIFVSPLAVLVAFAFAGAVGMFFGFYPGAQGGAPRSDRGAAVRIAGPPRRDRPARPAWARSGFVSSSRELLGRIGARDRRLA